MKTIHFNLDIHIINKSICKNQVFLQQKNDQSTTTGRSQYFSFFNKVTTALPFGGDNNNAPFKGKTIIAQLKNKNQYIQL